MPSGTPFAFTAPSVGHYPWQFYWDSCFTAITWRHFDPERSRRELDSLLAAQRDDGFIGHTIFWNRPLRGIRRFTYNVTSPGATMTSSIQPPLLAWAWSLAVGDPAAEPGIVRHHDWLERNRELDGDGGASALRSQWRRAGLDHGRAGAGCHRLQGRHAFRLPLGGRTQA